MRIQEELDADESCFLVSTLKASNHLSKTSPFAFLPCTGLALEDFDISGDD